MGPETALEAINASSPPGYTLAGKFSSGDEQGAYRVTDPAGKGFVLKLSRNPMWRSQIERAKAAADHLLTLGYPVAKYIYVGSSGEGTYWIEDELPGAPLIQPSAAQITELLRLIDLQKGQTISAVQGQDWSWFATNVVFRGDLGLVRVMMQFGAETSALAAEIEGLVRGLGGKTLGNTDLVHGDWNMSQVLAHNGAITGVLDWDQVGYGDCAMDLVSLWYSLMDQPEARDQIYAHLTQVSDPASIKIFAAYKMLAILAWNINTSGGNVTSASQQARTALEILGKL